MNLGSSISSHLSVISYWISALRAKNETYVAQEICATKCVNGSCSIGPAGYI